MFVRMPWGQYKGRCLQDIDESYLTWVLYEASAAKPWLKSAIRDELERRHRREEPRQSYAPLADLRGTIKSWFASLALDYHPDRTGDDGRAMKVVNDAHERLRKLVGIG